MKKCISPLKYTNEHLEFKRIYDLELKNTPLIKVYNKSNDLLEEIIIKQNDRFEELFEKIIANDK